ncbi:hypothetical protein [Taklimakanibacter deserti]|uniref:hypothetical protein n=1 Tax=Taklimakanibacter deserti TaxID=2267839 RepID=UPI000E658021
MPPNSHQLIQETGQQLADLQAVSLKIILQMRLSATTTRAMLVESRRLIVESRQLLAGSSGIASGYKATVDTAQREPSGSPPGLPHFHGRPAALGHYRDLEKAHAEELKA